MKSLAFKIIVSVFLCLALGIASGFSSANEINGWFTTIIKPSWNPPNWLFGPVWTLLYSLMGIAFALIWHSNDLNKKSALSIFAVQFILNLCWSFLFFNLHFMGVAFVEIIFMFLFIFLTIITFYKINKVASYLLVPYLLWVGFDSVLNGTIWNLNNQKY